MSAGPDEAGEDYVVIMLCRASIYNFLLLTQNVGMIRAKNYEKSKSVKVMTKILSVLFLFRHCVQV